MTWTNADEKKEWFRNYYRQNKEKYAKRSKEWAQAHPERMKELQKKWSEENPDRIKGYIQKQRMENLEAFRERTRERNRRWRTVHPERSLESSRKSNARAYQQSPEKWYARNLVARAIRNGDIIRPANCSQCGKACKAEGHHHNGYAPEHAFDVIWLCRACHRSVHY